MNCSGVITLTTDFGHKGPFAAVMRGVVLSRFRDATIVDLAHDIPPQWPPEAGFWIRRAYSYFPDGTVHVAIVDPGVGTERDILLVAADGHYFLAPDNGLLAELIDAADNAKVWRIDERKIAEVSLPSVSDTFHGRDIFAPIAAELAANRLQPDDVATPHDRWTPGWLSEPDIGASRITGTIITIDAFGNLISNVNSALLTPLHTPIANIAGRELPLLTTYGRASPGDYLALINSFDVVEIARAEGNAADGLGVERGAPLIIRDGYRA